MLPTLTPLPTILHPGGGPSCTLTGALGLLSPAVGGWGVGPAALLLLSIDSSTVHIFPQIRVQAQMGNIFLCCAKDIAAFVVLKHDCAALCALAACMQDAAVGQL